MGKPATTVGMSTTGHGCFPPQTITSASTDVFINGKPAALHGGAGPGHTCVKKPYPYHPTVTVGGSGTVMVNGKPAVRIGDVLSCGDVVAAGSSNVFMGD